MKISFLLIILSLGNSLYGAQAALFLSGTSYFKPAEGSGSCGSCCEISVSSNVKQDKERQEKAEKEKSSACCIVQ